MLDREVIEDFLLSKLKDSGIDIPEKIDIKELVEAFCKFIEDDYSEWLVDNFKSFFNHGNPDWNQIKEMLTKQN